MTQAQTIRHPARYTPALLPVFAEYLQGAGSILDPFAGTGERLEELQALLPGARIVGIELEPDWIKSPLVRQGNALDLPFDDRSFDAILTSPTYANRMADHHEARDDSPRNTYRHRLGRPLHPDNSGGLQWGREYRTFHLRAWTSALRVLKPGGVFVLNVKDHIRAGKRVRVTDWHIEALQGLGCMVTDRADIAAPGNRYGANGGLRVESEAVIRFIYTGHYY